MVVIRLSRGGSKARPFFNIVVADKRDRRDGRFIERIGFYNPQARGQAEMLRVAQDREQEKTFARTLGIGTADFIILRSAAALQQAMKTFPLPAILKSTRMGYDGKGQVCIQPGTDPDVAWREMGGEVWVDPNIRFTHRGSKAWEADFGDSIKATLASGVGTVAG